MATQTGIAPGQTSKELGHEPVRDHLTLLLLQVLLACLVLWPFISGAHYFAYLDIASDTYNNSTAFSQDLARLFGRQGWTGWTFQIGLGAPITFNAVDTLRLLTQLSGADHVLQLRIWVYLLKIVVGGACFLMLARQFVQRKEAALIAALCYSFCGYMVINGVWDSETAAFVFFPLVLWSLVRHFRTGDLVSFPLAVGATLLAGVFFVTLAVSLFVALLACTALAQDRRAMLRTWITRLAPLALLGFVIGGPVVLPLALQLLDSPRLAAGGAAVARVVQALAPTDLKTLSLQVAALFHKDLLGLGDAYLGYMNYLEGPGFYVGMLWLVLLPQLWRGDARDRRALLVGLTGCALYMLFPVFRLAAYGFAVPYFRVTTLWVALALLLLGVRALDRALGRVDVPMVWMGAAACVVLLVAGSAPSWGVLWPPHLLKVVLVLVAWTMALSVAGWRRMPSPRLASLILTLALVEAAIFAWPSYLAGRKTVDPGAEPSHDVTLPALQAIRQSDPGVYRVEKTYYSASQSDSATQDYMGVRSYYYHGRGVFEFHEALGMVPDFGPFRPINYTNWLEGPRNRFILHSLLGVKYVISKGRIDWPGFELAHQGPGWFAYRNVFALPLGVVQSRQMTRADFALANEPADRRQVLRELGLMHSVVLDTPQSQAGSPFDMHALAGLGQIDLRTAYERQAQVLQRTGLRIESFAQDRITGTIAPDQAGILVFSIPNYRGWSLRIDGQPAPLLQANFGLLAARVSGGVHQVDLQYDMPGLRTGVVSGALGLLMVLAMLLLPRWRRTGHLRPRATAVQ